jgi:hypothetical protein
VKIAEVYERLDKCRAISEEMGKIDERIREARLASLPKSPIWSDMPRCHGWGSDLSDGYSRIEELLFKKESLKLEWLDACLSAENDIMGKIKSDTAREYVRDFYYFGRSRAYIAGRYGVAYHSVWQAITRALRRVADDGENV